jgi:hypothetical protein
MMRKSPMQQRAESHDEIDSRAARAGLASAEELTASCGALEHSELAQKAAA